MPESKFAQLVCSLCGTGTPRVPAEDFDEAMDELRARVQRDEGWTEITRGVSMHDICKACVEAVRKASTPTPSELALLEELKKKYEAP
jgi:hypothetical protein